MTPEQLRISILKAAINGKLTPNEVSEDSDLPIGWSNNKIGKMASVVVGATPSTSNSNYWENGNIPWIPSGSCQNCDVESAPKFITQLGYDSCSTKLMPPDTVLIALTGATAGKVGYLKIEACGNQSVVGILPSDSMDQKYIYYYLMAERDTILSDCVGSAQPHISKAYIVDMDMNVPPLEEQHRIVAKIEELLPYVDRYAEAYEKLEKFNAKFPEDMKKSILQYAIQGKLVEQRPEEGTAEELYQQIQKEKQKLIKEGKIKKEKPLAEITEDEIPFDIPESWKWCRLQDICTLIADVDHNMPKSVPASEGKLFLSAKDLLDDGTINYTENVKYISKEDFERLSKKAKPTVNDIIYSRIGAALGKARVVENDIEFIVSYSCCVIRTLINEKYLRYYLESPLILRHSVLARQSIGVPDLGMGEIKQYIVALPPIEEQKRIVDRLEKILPYCNKLSK